MRLAPLLLLPLLACGGKKAKQEMPELRFNPTAGMKTYTMIQESEKFQQPKTYVETSGSQEIVVGADVRVKMRNGHLAVPPQADPISVGILRAIVEADVDVVFMRSGDLVGVEIAPGSMDDIERKRDDLIEMVKQNVPPEAQASLETTIVPMLHEAMSEPAIRDAFSNNAYTRLVPWVGPVLVGAVRERETELNFNGTLLPGAESFEVMEMLDCPQPSPNTDCAKLRLTQKFSGEPLIKVFTQMFDAMLKGGPMEGAQMDLSDPTITTIAEGVVSLGTMTVYSWQTDRWTQAGLTVSVQGQSQTMPYQTALRTTTTYSPVAGD